MAVLTEVSAAKFCGRQHVFLTAAMDLTGDLDKFGFLSLFLAFLPFLRSHFAIY